MGLTVRFLHHLRRRHLLSPLSFVSISSPLQFSPVQPRLPSNPLPHDLFFLGGGFSSRSYSWFSNSRNSDDTHRSSELLESDFGVDASITEATTQLESGSGSEVVVTENSFWDYPIELVTGFLDGYHDVTGFPWWIIIASSTVAMRFSLLPILWLQMKKVSKIAQLFPQLPPPFPPPFSGRSWSKQYLLFEKERKKLGCPSFFWNFSYLSVQFPTFILWMSCIRSMCLNHHPGLETGGALWFQNLTNTPHGVVGCILPFMIAGLHYTNVQLSFKSVQLDKLRGIYGRMFKYYKLYLDAMSIPLFVVGLLVPQGSLVYWTTNSMFTLFQVGQDWLTLDPMNFIMNVITPAGLPPDNIFFPQNLSLKNEYVRVKLGIPDIKSQRVKFTSSSENTAHSLIAMDQEAMESLSHDQLLDISLEQMAAGKHDSSVKFLRVALEKDPDSVKALVAMSQKMFEKKSFEEAIAYVERAVSKIKEDDPLLVLALFTAGLSHRSLGNKVAAINHLKRIPNLSVPEKIMEKACYYKALALLGCYLFEEGKTSEAIVYLRTAATYDPGVNSFVKECEEAMEQGKTSSSEEAIEEDKKSVG